MKREIKKRSMFSISGYFAFFAMVLFASACNLVLYESTVRKADTIANHTALYVMANIIFLSLLLTIINSIRKKIVLEKPMKRILQAVNQISNGQFDTQIEPIHLKKKNEFDEIIEGINRMARELSHVETLKTDFISNVSHEIKTPLAVIQNYSDMLNNPALTEEERQSYAGIIADATKRLNNLVVNILKLNRLENQEIYPDKRKFNLGEQIRCVLLSYEEKWSDKDLDLDLDLPDISIENDPELLEIVWNNLISNAVKFTSEHGKISIHLTKEDEKVKVIVSDTGCGMDETTGKHIFEKFYQGDTSHAKEGNGLGLAMVKRVIDISKGEIMVKSTRGIGTIFTVIL